MKSISKLPVTVNEAKTEYKWIKFVKIPTKNKTDVYNVIAKEGEYLLGVVKWFGTFRCYSFFPNANTVYEKICLRDISDFLEALMKERRENKK